MGSGLSGGASQSTGTTSAGFVTQTETDGSGTSGTMSGTMTDGTTSMGPTSDSTGDPTGSTDPTDPSTTTESTTGIDECDEGIGLTCTEPTNLGPVTQGSEVNTLVTTVSETADNWYHIQFPTMTRPGEGVPTVMLDMNTNDAFAFELFIGGNPCVDEPMDCQSGGGQGGLALDLTEWDFSDLPIDGMTMMPGYQPPDDNLADWPTDVFVHVYRVDATNPCESYRLTAMRP